MKEIELIENQAHFASILQHSFWFSLNLFVKQWQKVSRRWVKKWKIIWINFKQKVENDLIWVKLRNLMTSKKHRSSTVPGEGEDRCAVWATSLGETIKVFVHAVKISKMIRKRYYYKWEKKIDRKLNLHYFNKSINIILDLLN